MKISKYVLMSLLAAFIISCDGEDGMDGRNGIDGINGTDGTNGTNGQDGAQGPAGQDGANGADGQDGSANIDYLTFDLSAASGTSFQLDSNPVSANVVENGTALAYLNVGDEWYQIPNQRILTNGFALIDIATAFFKSGNQYIFRMNFLRSGVPIAIGAGDLDTLRLINITPSSNTSGKNINNDPLNELIENGIDVTDFYQVIDYYGLEY